MDNSEKPSSCFGCGYNKRENICKLGIYNEEKSKSCIFAMTEESLPNNDRTKRHDIKIRREFIELMKEDPIRFICDVCKVNLKWYQRIILQNLFKNTKTGDECNGKTNKNTDG